MWFSTTYRLTYRVAEYQNPKCEALALQSLIVLTKCECIM